MKLEQLRRAWRTLEPGRLLGRGPPAGETRFLDADGKLLVFALTTLRKIPMKGALGDA